MKFLTALFFILFFISCSAEDQMAISAGGSDNKLVIQNNTDQEVFYFIVARNCAPLIDWIPTLSGPKLDGGKSTTINYEEIYNCSEELTATMNDEIIIYWWFRSYPETNKVEHLIIKLK
ncbi:MAG: hypothetical protein H6627_09205 [Calditrichae bacterium]|nr:hypothetical protein [Calditrichia bacterium]